jgi:cardiolipin synthase A/B
MKISNILPFFSSHKLLLLFCGFIILFSGFAYIQSNKKMPPGTDFASKNHIKKSDNINFLYDLSYVDKNGNQITEQQIFDEIFSAINKASHYILIDMFLFNDYLAASKDSYRPLSGELTNTLIEKKLKNPDIKIDFITDPINTVYGGSSSWQIEALQKNGINVIISDLSPLRDSNLLYSFFWRGFFSYFKFGQEFIKLKHPFSLSENKVSLRSYLKMANFKANHRKVFMADDDGDMVSIISSANPHDGSSAHSNVAMKIRGEFWKSLWYSEAAIAIMSGNKLQSPPTSIMKKNYPQDNDHNISIELITEKKIKETLIQAISSSEKNDRIQVAMFYLSERDIIKSLLDASKRGVEIKIILDPNKDAFGYKKIGIPNRQAAFELHNKSNGRINIKWYNTKGEQFHSKMVLISHKNGPSRIILGSANLTRRNIENFNLESNVSVIAPSSSVFIQDASKMFNEIWSNTKGECTLDYTAYKDHSLWKYLVYRLQEASGLSSF